MSVPKAAIRRIAMLGNHLPRQCGIATFTSDLSDALSGAHPDLDCLILAMNDPGKQYTYPPRVRFEIAESDIGSYHRAADFLNVNDVPVVSVQHEYGIFGGKSGAHLLALLRDLRMPIVTTLHTILAAPNATQRAVMTELCALSERIVVMSSHGADLLREVHHVPASKIDLIPHGTPVLPESPGSKDTLGVQGKSVILTFGLLSPDKGIEYVIDALPEIVRHHPEVIYIVLGVTHPHVKERDGEVYRLMLESRGHRLGVGDNLIFHDRFVSHAELVQYLSAADIYITPYLNAEQITSGTLAFALGSGKAVVSTPYQYARELLADGRGLLVPYKDSGAIASEVIGLLGDHKKRGDLQDRAKEFGRAMTWPVVANSYMQSFERAALEHRGRLKSSFKASTMAKRQVLLPDVNLGHLRALTDDTGMLQHAVWNIPRYEDGYCLDDNARALILVTLIEDEGMDRPAAVRMLATRYLAFVHHAFDPKSGRFRNFMSYGRQWTEDLGSEDSHGRALWSLGTVFGRSADHGRRGLADSLFRSALEITRSFSSPRAWAYTLLGIDEYLRAVPEESRLRETRAALAERLLHRFRESSHTDWPWFEDRLTYSNARLPQAMIVSGHAMGNSDMVATGLRSLTWLSQTQQTQSGMHAPIGSNGFFVRGDRKAEFDQQPVEACGMVSACLEAYRVTGQKSWLESARRAFDWFLGRNQLEQWVYDATTGGCRDGLHADRPNENQGAESTLSFLMSLVDMRVADRPLTTRAASTAPSNGRHMSSEIAS